MTEILSYGGGTQTIAMCILVARGVLPMPNYVIAADTGREMPTTWEYADKYARPLLARVGLDLHIAGHDLATVDIYGKNGDILIPAHTHTAKLPTFCSSEWKEQVVYRYTRRVLNVTGDVRNWIGFSLDERKRMTAGEIPRRYPLIDLMLTRADCIALIKDEGIPLPKKSRCYICPHQHAAEWIEVYERPELWQQAVQLDNEIHAIDERGGLYLHESRRALGELSRADLEQGRSLEPSRQCGMGLCFL